MAVNEESVPPDTVMSPTAKSVAASDRVKVMVSVWPDLSVPEPVRVRDTVGAVVSIVAGKPEEDVCVSVTPSICVVATERNLYRPGESSAVTQLHAPVDVSALHAEPVLVQLPVDALMSEVDDAVAYDNCTDAPIAAVPVKVSVWLEVMLSEVDTPPSEVTLKSGVVGAGTKYRMTTIPDPPSPPKLELASPVG